MVKSPLYDLFAAQGAVFEDAAGYAVAAHTIGLEAERKAIRNQVGIWDHSDMGKIRVKGDGARELVDRTIAGDIEGLPENTIRYTLILDDAGKIVSDVQVYNNFDEFFITCGAAAKDRVLAALQSRAGGDAEIEDVTSSYAAICIEGPLAWRMPSALTGVDVRSLRLLTFTHFEIGGGKGILSRIGYCGEYGYILFIPPDAAPDALRSLQRRDESATLCGRQIQDLLRLEVRSFNLGKDIPNAESPLEAGLHWMIDFRKEDFPGREAVISEKNRGISRKLVAFELSRAEAANGLGIVRDGRDRVGYAANFDFSPGRERTIGVAYLDEQYGWCGLNLQVETATGIAPIRTVSAPFVLTESNKVRIS